jgi:hypothetical protein
MFLRQIRHYQSALSKSKDADAWLARKTGILRAERKTIPVIENALT